MYKHTIKNENELEKQQNYYEIKIKFYSFIKNFLRFRKLI